MRAGVGLQALALLAYAVLPAALGIAARAVFPALANHEMALPSVLRELLPPWLGALLLAAVFSAEISSADAVLFMLSTSLARDVYQSFLNPGADDAALLRATRRVALAAGAAGTLAAMALPTVIAALTIFYGLLAVMLLVPLLAGLYSTRGTGGAALLAMAISLLVAAVAHAATAGRGWGILTPAAAGILAGAAVMAVSMAFAGTRRESHV